MSLNRGVVALACSMVGTVGRSVVLASRPERGVDRAASASDTELMMIAVFAVIACVGFGLGLLSLFNRASVWWGLAAIVVAAAFLL